MRRLAPAVTLLFLGCGPSEFTDTGSLEDDESCEEDEAVEVLPMLAHRYDEGGAGVIVQIEEGVATETVSVTGTQSARFADGRIGVWSTEQTLTVIDPTDWSTESADLGVNVQSFGACGDGLLAILDGPVLPVLCTESACTELDQDALSGEFDAYFSPSKVIGGETTAYLLYVTSEREYTHRVVPVDCTNGILNASEYISVSGTTLIPSEGGWWLPYTIYDTRIDAGVKFYDPVAENALVFEIEHEGVIEDGVALEGYGLAYALRDEDYGSIGGGDSTLRIVNQDQVDVEVGPIDDISDKALAWVQAGSADQTAIWIAETDAIQVVALERAGDTWTQESAPEIALDPWDYTSFLGALE